MAPEEGRNVRNKLVTITLAVIFVIKIQSVSDKITVVILRDGENPSKASQKSPFWGDTIL